MRELECSQLGFQKFADRLSHHRQPTSADRTLARLGPVLRRIPRCLDPACNKRVPYGAKVTSGRQRGEEDLLALVSGPRQTWWPVLERSRPAGTATSQVNLASRAEACSIGLSVSNRRLLNRRLTDPVRRTAQARTRERWPKQECTLQP